MFLVQQRIRNWQTKQSKAYYEGNELRESFYLVTSTRAMRERALRFYGLETTDVSKTVHPSNKRFQTNGLEDTWKRLERGVESKGKWEDDQIFYSKYKVALCPLPYHQPTINIYFLPESFAGLLCVLHLPFLPTSPKYAAATHWKSWRSSYPSLQQQQHEESLFFTLCV